MDIDYSLLTEVPGSLASSEQIQRMLTRYRFARDYCRGKWCRGPELNWRHKDFQSSALPTELPRHEDELWYSSGVGLCQNSRLRAEGSEERQDSAKG